MGDDDRNLRERIGDAVDRILDRDDDDVDAEVKVHRIDSLKHDDRVNEDER